MQKELEEFLTRSIYGIFPKVFSW